MKGAVGRQFSTYDKDNDLYETINCAVNRTGAWWYNQCSRANLNGEYQSETLQAVRWSSWTGYKPFTEKSRNENKTIILF